MNRELFERNQDLWDALEESRWSPFNPDKIVAVAAAKSEDSAVAAA